MGLLCKRGAQTLSEADASNCGPGGSDPLPDPTKKGHLRGRDTRAARRRAGEVVSVWVPGGSVPLGLPVTRLLERGFTVPLCVQPGSAQLCARACRRAG